MTNCIATCDHCRTTTTLNSGFAIGKDLIPGWFRLTIKGKGGILPTHVDICSHECLRDWAKKELPPEEPPNSSVHAIVGFFTDLYVHNNTAPQRIALLDSMGSYLRSRGWPVLATNCDAVRDRIAEKLDEVSDNEELTIELKILPKDA